MSKPDGFWKIDAETNGYQIIVWGDPPDLDGSDPLCHNCDEMGCPSVGGHIVCRIPVMYPNPELTWNDSHKALREPQEEG